MEVPLYFYQKSFLDKCEIKSAVVSTGAGSSCAVDDDSVELKGGIFAMKLSGFYYKQT